MPTKTPEPTGGKQATASGKSAKATDKPSRVQTIEAREGHGEGFSIVSAPLQERETLSDEQAAERDQQGGD